MPIDRGELRAAMRRGRGRLPHDADFEHTEISRRWSPAAPGMRTRELAAALLAVTECAARLVGTERAGLVLDFARLYGRDILGGQSRMIGRLHELEDAERTWTGADAEDLALMRQLVRIGQAGATVAAPDRQLRARPGLRASRQRVHGNSTNTAAPMRAGKGGART